MNPRIIKYTAPDPILESHDADTPPRIQFFTPDELRDYQPESDIVLVGDCHIMRGEVFVIGGEPGVGKSTAATELAICGATGRDWLGLPVHSRFKTMIIQNENGRFRLRQEFAAREQSAEIQNSILVSEPPPFGMTLNHPDFLSAIHRRLTAFAPDVVVFDPWNAAAKDDKAADYCAAFDALRSLLPTDARKPALGIVAHTRKPQFHDKRTGGSGLMHLLAGSYILTSVPRAIFIMVRGSAQDTDDTVVFLNPKNNNGPCTHRTAWHRSPHGFAPCPDFDWEAFEGDAPTERKGIQWEHLEETLAEGPALRAEVVKHLMFLTGCGERACQKAIEPRGRYGDRLVFDELAVGLKE